MKKESNNLLSGFTLIELLVVISIISLLASIVLASLNSARVKARDARRKADLNQLRTALAFYYDSNNAYPGTGSAWFESENGCCGNYNSGNYIPGLTPAYISTLPRDLRGGAGTPQPTCGPWLQAYIYFSDTVNYTLLSHCAPEGTWTSSDGFYDPSRRTWAWRVCSSQTLCT